MTITEAKANRKKTILDPMAVAKATPDIAALQTEFALAMEWGPSQQELYGLAMATRLNRWEGQTTDGLKWQKFQPRGTVVRPYDGRPDTRQPFTDNIINALVDIDMVALHGAQMKPSPTHANKLTADESAEIRAVGRWMTEGPLLRDMVDGAEYLSQMKNTMGWCVLHPCWQTRHGLTRKTMTMEQLEQLAATAAQRDPGGLLARLPEIIRNEGAPGGEATDTNGEQATGDETSTTAAEMPQQDNADTDWTGKSAEELLRLAYPYLKAKTAARIARELREDGETEFLYREVIENRPRIKVLVPGIDVFLPEEVQDERDARAWFTREYYSEAQLRAMVVNEDWNADWVEAACQTAGEVSFGDENVSEQMRDKNARRIEVITSYVTQGDEDGVSGIYCTVYSAFVNDKYGAYFMMDYAHGQYPFVLARTEIIGPRPDSSRGVPAVMRTQQWELKRQRDNTHILSELQTNPPRVRIGLGWSKAQEQFAPGSDITNAIQGSDLKYLAPPGSNGQLALALCELIRAEGEDHFGLPRNKTESHPARWQARQARTTKRWLLTWNIAYWQLLVLVYDTYTREELTDIIGRPPQLTTEKLLQQQVNLVFDARSMDPEWVEMLLDAIAKIRGWNTGGTMDDNKLVNFALSYMDPTLGDTITSDQAGAANAVYKDVEHQLMSVMQGNPPQLAENDPTAGMKLKFAQQIIGQNPEYQMTVFPKLANNAPNPHFNEQKAKNLKTLMDNWQHNVQETQTSKMQGRLGVQAVNNAPVQRGPVARN